MSIFNKRSRIVFLEADDEDVNSAQETEQNEPESKDDTTENISDDNDQDSKENEEDNKESEKIEDNSDLEQDDQEEDFSIDSDDNFDKLADEAKEGGDNMGSSDSSNSSTSSSSSSSDEDLEDNELKKNDKNLFDSLSDAEQKVKVKTLKELYIQLYSSADNFIDKFGSLSMEFDGMNEQLSRINTSLYTLKKMISDYLLNRFDTSSYMENDIMYNKYLSMLNSIKNISDELKKAYFDSNSQS